MRKWPTRQFIRALHVVICLSVLLPLLLRPSVLHRMVFYREDVIHGGLYLACFFASLCVYFIASYTDPGYLTCDKARLFRHRRGDSSECGDDSVADSHHVATSHAQSFSITNRKSYVSGRVHLLAWLANVSRWFVASLSSWWYHTDFADPAPVYNLSVPVRFCKHCLLEQPLRCRHCPQCERCVMKFDHHCPWIANCVGERNHPSFVVFLALQTLVLWWTVYFAVVSVEPNHSLSEWFRVNGLVFVLMVGLTVLGIPLTILLGFHVYLALGSRTTWETVSHERIVYLKHLDDHVNPFNQGCARNCYSFCCSRYPFGWDRIYAEAVEKQVIPPNSSVPVILPVPLDVDGIHPSATSKDLSAAV